ncbi:MAG: DNA/RNA non-specific endonuclease, partial [Clostridia bacterium]|nr:DNA/RNA non-specific endonuclease [Clostridia bacterium]
MLLSFAACDTATTDSATVFPETGTTTVTTTRNTADSVTLSAVSLDAIPAYSGEPFIFINDNVPFFTDAEKGTTASFETYSPLDSLGRCGVTFACVGKDIMPTESRGDISSVKPSGWHNEAYDFVDGRYVYNRCHLLGFQLTGENANERNLITGTRYMNVDGMLPFENMVADYVKETGNHVLLRVTPLFNGDELVARGVLMEAYSVEDDGDGICYNVYCYNVQPGVTIDYATGYNHADNTGAVTQPSTAPPATYVLNTNTLKIHTLSCSSV